MLLYKFEAATPWRVALTNDEVGKTLPTEGAPWRLMSLRLVEVRETSGISVVRAMLISRMQE
jgi:hypothetical protein